MSTRVCNTGLGAVEVVYLRGERPPVLFFPGGHCSAASDCGWSLYTSEGFGVLAFSRPGYGATDVGALTAAEFVPAVVECCEQMAVHETSAAVGVSFGGMQAIHAARSAPSLVPRLILHSCAPSTNAYPDTARERSLGPVAFAPAVERLTWAAVGRLVASETGLRRMVGALSSLPTGIWWHTWSTDDKERARTLFRSMRSGTGFMNDLRQARADRCLYRRLMQTEVPCPTLVTASRHDGGVAFAHAVDQAHTIQRATLVELGAPSHLFWLGPEVVEAQEAVREFLNGHDASMRGS
ncbi:alpha/beta fold hydrolase [Tessaracoccus antarcticus]|uniref:Alpha/beta hydrolase n=1 Tax=Tessaracoccus antarcticus TaxID=2479848 RepID=A0A3M0G2A6_9ACTN|nr:alpha/beta hydrolase [Tessaracoccus antarcticus]RMB58718.1 alpha/beta hydrolase [Tessaracoccus antarcticus]